MIVTIDGTAGSGKSTLARKLALRFQALHINSGYLYRSIAFEAQQSNVSLADSQALGELADGIEWKIAKDFRGGTTFSWNGRLSADGLKSDELGDAASILAQYATVREVCDHYQRLLIVRAEGSGSPVFLEGRDAGTVIAPQALVKFYVDAPLHVRAHRRLLQLQSINKEASYDIGSIAERIRARDHRDMTRKLAPQVPAEGAIRLDSAAESQGPLLRRMEQIVREAMAAGEPPQPR